MEYSDFLSLSLPSRDNDVDIADINVISDNFVTLDTFCGKTIPNMLQSVGEEFEEATSELGNRLSEVESDFTQLTPEQTYNPNSEKAQSGRAVAQAVDKYSSLDLLSLTFRDKNFGWVSLEGKWIYVGLDNYVFVVLPVLGGDVLEIAPNSNAVASIACLRSFDGAEQDANVDFSEDENWQRRIDVNSDKSYVLPNDARYLFVAIVYSGTDCAPVKCKVSGYDYALPARNNIQNLYKMIENISGNSILDHTVTFYVGEEPYEVVSVKDGNSVNSPLNNPTSENGTFAGWSIGGTSVAFPYMPTDNTNIEAMFQSVRDEISCNEAGVLISSVCGTKANDGLCVCARFLDNENDPNGWNYYYLIGENAESIATSGSTLSPKMGTFDYEGEVWHYAKYSKYGEPVLDGEVEFYYGGEDSVARISLPEVLDYYFMKT
jgi:hypothetical protein